MYAPNEEHQTLASLEKSVLDLVNTVPIKAKFTFSNKATETRKFVIERLSDDVWRTLRKEVQDKFQAICWDKFLGWIAKVLRVGCETVLVDYRMRYIDEDGDHIDFDRDSEFRLALTEARAPGKGGFTVEIFPRKTTQNPGSVSAWNSLPSSRREVVRAHMPTRPYKIAPFENRPRPVPLGFIRDGMRLLLISANKSKNFYLGQAERSVVSHEKPDESCVWIACLQFYDTKIQVQAV